MTRIEEYLKEKEGEKERKQEIEENRKERERDKENYIIIRYLWGENKIHIYNKGKRGWERIMM